MVKKDDLFDWFQNLQPRKRLDYMCALLHLLLPLELRFIGSVLEDLARKDFNHLRDAEIKANQRNDLSVNPTNIEDPNLRNKISIALALMNSTNSSCADIIFSILESQVDALIKLLRNKDVAEQVSLILTMAVYHPAFKFYQRNRLGEILQLVLDKMKDQHGDEDKVSLQIKRPNIQEQNTSFSSQSSYAPESEVPGKLTLKAIEVYGAREDQSSKKGSLKSHREESFGRRGCPEYEIHTTWSNGEVTQIFMKYRQFQDLHHRVLNKFPEEKDKKQRTIPIFPGQSLKTESIDSQIATLNSYLSQLTKTAPHILECEILHTALRNGPVIRCIPPPQQAPPQAANEISSSSDLVHEDNHPYAISSKRGSVCDNPAMITSSACSSDASQLILNASPANSRTSSPASTLLMGGKSNWALIGGERVGDGNAMHLQPHQGSNIELSLNQLLCLLNLDNYSDNLKEFSFKQILSMSIEDFSKAGLPEDARLKLRAKLDQLKLTFQGRNGIITKATSFPPVGHHQLQLPPSASMADAATAPYPFPYLHVSPNQLTYLPPGSSFSPHPQPILTYPHLAPPAMSQHTAVLATPLMPHSSSASANQQHQPVPLMPLSPMTSSQFQQDLLASPDFTNSNSSSPPNSPHLGQESQHQLIGSNSTTVSGSGEEVSTGQATSTVVAYMPAASSSSGGQAPVPLPMMSPPAAVAADTLALSEVKQLKNIFKQESHALEDSAVDEEDIRPGYQDLGNLGKTKSANQHQVPVTGNVSIPGNVMSNAVAGEEPVRIMSSGHTPLLSGDILLRTDGNPTPPLPPTVLAGSSQSSGVLANGYIAEPPVHVPSAVIGRPLHSLPQVIGGLGGFKVAAQPTHTAPGLQKVIKMPGLDHPSHGTAGTKSINSGTGFGMNGNNQGQIHHPATAIPPHHHSYMPPPVAGAPHQSNNNGNNSTIITSSSVLTNSSSQLISQPPPAPLTHAEGNYLTFYMPTFPHSHHHHQRGIVTSVAGSTNVINTTQSHHSGHSPSPRSSDVYKVNAADALPTEPASVTDQHGSPTSQSPPHQQLGSMKVQSHPSGQHSSTPSPPLIPSAGNVKASFIPIIVSSSMLAPGNEPGPVAIRGNAGGAQQMLPYYIMLPTQNGMYPHIYTHHPHPSQQAGGHHSQPPPPQPAFPNGLGPGAPNPSHDPFMRPLGAPPQFNAGGQVPPNFYGNSVYPPPHHHSQHPLQQHHQHNSNSNSHHGRNTNSPAGVNSSGPSQLLSKAVCYNCGQPGHRAADCKESTMENMSNSYRLNFEPKADPQ